MGKVQFLLVRLCMICLLAFPVSVTAVKPLPYDESGDIPITEFLTQSEPIPVKTCEDVKKTSDYVGFVLYQMEKNPLIQSTLAKVARSLEVKIDVGRILIGINYDGSLRYLRIVDPFGNEEFGQIVLDSLKTNIFPLCPFTREMRQEVDLVEIIRTVYWKSNNLNVL